MAWTATENFDTYTSGNSLNGESGGSGWNGNWTIVAGQWETTNAQSVSSPNSGVHLSSTADQPIYRVVNSITAGHFSFYMRVSATGISEYMNLSASASHATNIKVLGGFEGTNIVFYDNATQRTLVTGYNADQWYKVTIELTGSDTYTVQIDSGTVNGPYAYSFGGTGAITHFHFYRGGGTGSFFFDSIAPVAGAGPANLKSLNTNVKANVKSYNTNVLANIKSIDTNA